METPPVLDSAASVREVVEKVFLWDCSPGITFLMCDETNRGTVAAPCDDAPLHPSYEECLQTASLFAKAMAPVDGGVLLVINRPSPSLVVDSDRSWYRAMRTACAEYGARLIGVWLVTPGQARELSPDDVF